ncbi:sulfotransferase [Euzebya pacifica]|uniref:sulfotransferase n=1 Tax=Euzebya pacifica TaxID=1608957 RepID=UPI0030FC68FE
MTAGDDLFFGVGTGRCGTMLLANLLHGEADVACLHEGKLRHGAEPGDQWLPFLTLQNLAAYHTPERADELFEAARGSMSVVRRDHGVGLLGDIAYNYAPFVPAIRTRFPAARIVVMVRHGVGFVRSAHSVQGPDPTPVGWPEPRRLDRVERFIGLGRLRPRPGDDAARRWTTMDAVARNAWLWAETNRIVLDAVAGCPTDRLLVVPHEALVEDALGTYRTVRRFLGITGPLPASARETLQHRINARPSKALGPWADWSPERRASFLEHAGHMMQRLGYDVADESAAPRSADADRLPGGQVDG